MKTIFFDVMLNERFVKTFKYRYNPLFGFDMDELREFVISKLPTLKNKDFKICF